MINNYSNFEFNLVSEKEEVYQKIIDIFHDLAMECHVFGSIARGDSDPYSDIDICFTFKDENMQNVLKKRLEYFSKIEEIVHICEAPQNSPVNGKYSCVLFKTQHSIVHVDFYLCPLSTSHTTKEGKKIFGDIDLPIRELELNPKKVLVDKNYRIDFFLTFIFGGIKKLLRDNKEPLQDIFKEYSYLQDRYDIKVEPLIETSHSFETLKTIISNIMQVSNEKQRFALLEISDFLEQVEVNFL